VKKSVSVKFAAIYYLCSLNLPLMPFRLIKNRTQSIAVKGFIAMAVICGVVAIFIPWSIQVTSPFLLVWVMIWFIGGSIDSKSS